MDVAHCRGKDTDNGNTRKFLIVLIFLKIKIKFLISLFLCFFNLFHFVFILPNKLFSFLIFLFFLLVLLFFVCCIFFFFFHAPPCGFAGSWFIGQGQV